MLGIGSTHNVLIVITEGHAAPLPPLHFIAELPQQLQAGFLMQERRSLLGDLQAWQLQVLVTCIVAMFADAGAMPVPQAKCQVLSASKDEETSLQ